MASRKAQASLEFLIVFSVLLAIFLFVFALSFGGNGNLIQIQDSAASMRNAQSIAAAINYVYLAGDGASYNLAISNVLNVENITLSNHAVSSTRRNAYSSAALLNGKMNFTSLGRGNVFLTNNGGEIDANQ
jgi:uncharacterized protein (UPF0333 family)